MLLLAPKLFLLPLSWIVSRPAPFTSVRDSQSTDSLSTERHSRATSRQGHGRVVSKDGRLGGRDDFQRRDKMPKCKTPHIFRVRTACFVYSTAPNSWWRSKYSQLAKLHQNWRGESSRQRWNTGL